jgi:hypothetical protein
MFRDESVKITLYTDTLLRRSPLKASLYNQQILLEKWENSDFEESIH